VDQWEDREDKEGDLKSVQFLELFAMGQLFYKHNIIDGAKETTRS
jgi:hypothetical protein